MTPATWLIVVSIIVFVAFIAAVFIGLNVVLYRICETEITHGGQPKRKRAKDVPQPLIYREHL